MKLFVKCEEPKSYCEEQKRERQREGGRDRADIRDTVHILFTPTDNE